MSANDNAATAFTSHLVASDKRECYSSPRPSPSGSMSATMIDAKELVRTGIRDQQLRDACMGLLTNIDRLESDSMSYDELLDSDHWEYVRDYLQSTHGLGVDPIRAIVMAVWTVILKNVHRTSLDTAVATANIAPAQRAKVDVRVRVEADPKRRCPGMVSGLGGSDGGWLLLACDDARVLEVNMQFDEIASETVQRFVHAYDPAVPGLDSNGRVPPGLAAASKALALRMLGVPS